jgi:virulence-associated protein VagC
MTSKGLLIPRAALQGWGEVQVVREEHRIVIQPKTLTPDQERELVAQALRETGLFYEPEQEPDLPVVLDEERAELAEKLNVGRSLLDSVVEGRDEGA